MTVPAAVAARAARLREWYGSRIPYGRPLAIATAAFAVTYTAVKQPAGLLFWGTLAAALLVGPIRRAVWPALKCVPTGARTVLWPPLGKAWRRRPLFAAVVQVVRLAVVLVVGNVILTVLFGWWVPAFARLGVWLVCSLAVLALVGGWRPGPQKVVARGGWWEPANVNRALTHIGLLDKPKPDAKGRNPSMASRWPAGRYDAATGELRLPLPRGRTFSEVDRQWEAFVSALGVPLGLTTLTRCASGLANVVVIRVAAPLTDTVRSHLGTAQVTRWHSPLRIGRDDRGQLVTTQTHEANTLIAGMMGYGKTSAGRIVAAHALLDPAARVWIIDGKGSRADWSDAEPAVERLVLGTDEDAAAQASEVLGTILDEIRVRNAASKGRKGTPGGLVLILDEWQDVRAAAGKTGGVKLDELLGRVIRMGRSSGVHVVIITQRPSVEDVPSSARNLLSHRLALVLRNAEDFKIALGETPTLPLPKRKGEALLTCPDGTVAVQLDHLDDKAWAAVCQRSAERRERTRLADATLQAPDPVADPSPHTGEPVLEPLAHAQPVASTASPKQTVDERRLSCVLAELRHGPQVGMLAGDIFADIAEDLDLPARDRGRWLGQQRDRAGAPIRYYSTGPRRLWQIVEATP